MGTGVVAVDETPDADADGPQRPWRTMRPESLILRSTFFKLFFANISSRSRWTHIARFSEYEKCVGLSDELSALIVGGDTEFGERSEGRWGLRAGVRGGSVKLLLHSSKASLFDVKRGNMPRSAVDGRFIGSVRKLCNLCRIEPGVTTLFLVPLLGGATIGERSLPDEGERTWFNGSALLSSVVVLRSAPVKRLNFRVPFGVRGVVG